MPLVKTTPFTPQQPRLGSEAPAGKRLKILFLPADSIEPQISRSAYLARGLSRYADVYYVTWHDTRSAEWQGLPGGAFHTMACAVRSFFQHMGVARPEADQTFYRVSCSVMLDAIVHRIVGRITASKLKYVCNRRTLLSLIQSVRPDVVFYADGFYLFPFVEGDHVSVSDIQDDVDWSRATRRFAAYAQRFLADNLSKVNRAYIVSEAAKKNLNSHLPIPASFVALPNGADFAEIRGVTIQKTQMLREKHKLQGKTVVSYIGGSGKFDPEFAGRLFAHAETALPATHFVVVGNVPERTFRNVTWIGPVPPEEAAVYFNLSDVGVILRDGAGDPFLANSAPLKVVQYAAARKPVTGFLPTPSADRRIPNLFPIESSNPEEWCRQLQHIRETFVWTPKMDEIWEPYSWDALSQRVIRDLDSLVSGYRAQ